VVFTHVPAMLDEVLYYLDPKDGGVYADGTLGGAGHASAIINKIGPSGTLVGIDQDINAIRNAREKFKGLATDIRLFHDNFSSLPRIMEETGIRGFDGILVDIGLSQHQLSESGRGFSFMKDEPLDMRMDTRNPVTAADLIADLSEKELADLFFTLGEERFSRQVARAVVRERGNRRIETSRELSDIVALAIPKKAAMSQKIHPATRVFQALRIRVNDELGNLKSFLGSVESLLKPGGRLCVLSFHSLEDRLVKEKIRDLEGRCTCPPDFPLCVCGRKPVARPLSRKAVRPSEAEVERNPMARSTRLRACEKL
jgi:16S rRNA (cytosine1402-N4)-methyltransferase